MKTIKIPSNAIVDLCTESPTNHVTHHTGDVIIFLEKIAYMRNTALNTGLLRMVTGVDININEEWYNKVVEAVS